MNITKYIPNLLTLGNLLCGTIATIFAVNSEFVPAALFVVLGIFFDFFDGFAARLFNVSGELGKQLDSLADMVTSGVAPGIIKFNLLSKNEFQVTNLDSYLMSWTSLHFSSIQFVGLLLTLAACYRLANFNIDTRQSNSFIGLPTPAMSLFVISLPLIVEYSGYDFAIALIQNNYFLVTVTIVLSLLMNAEVPLFSLKFKNYKLKDNLITYLFLIASLVLIISLKYISIPLIIILYVMLSLVSNFKKT